MFCDERLAFPAYCKVRNENAPALAYASGSLAIREIPDIDGRALYVAIRGVLDAAGFPDRAALYLPHIHAFFFLHIQGILVGFLKSL